MGELLLESVLHIIFGIIQFLFMLPGELAIGMASGWTVRPFDDRRGWLEKSLAVLISLCFWSIAGLLIYFVTSH